MSRLYCVSCGKTLRVDDNGNDQKFPGSCATCYKLDKFVKDETEERRIRAYVADQNAYKASVKGAKKKKR